MSERLAKVMLFGMIVVLLLVALCAPAGHTSPPSMFKVDYVDMHKNQVVLTPYISPSFLATWIDSVNRVPVKGEILHCKPGTYVDPKAPQTQANNGQTYSTSYTMLDCKGMGQFEVEMVSFVPEQP